MQIRCALREEPEQTIARFLMCLNPAILERVELQPFWTFEDACKLAVKVEKQLKSRRPYSSAPPKPVVPVQTFNFYKSEPAPKDDKDKGKERMWPRTLLRARRNVSSAMAMVTFRQITPI